MPFKSNNDCRFYVTIESGLVVVAPVKKHNSHAWSFTKPFTEKLSLVTVSSFLFIGVVMWVLERGSNKEFCYDDWKKQIVTILSYVMQSIFFLNMDTLIFEYQYLVNFLMIMTNS